jgi:hypothetical protein
MVASAQLIHYLEEAKIEELTRQWEAKGYQVLREAPVGDFRADLVATRGDETIIFEVETADSLAQNKELVSRLASLAAQHPKTSFRLVVANPPQQKTFRIENLDNILFDYFAREALPVELDRLSTHTSVEGITEVDVLDVQIQPGKMRVSGDGVMEVRLQHGSGGDVQHDMGLVTYDSFPFRFDVTLDANLSLVEMNQLEIDTSSWE